MNDQTGTRQNFSPVAFDGRVSLGRHGGWKPVRKVHLALDVNEGETLCGLDLAYVEAAGQVRISVPRRWTAMESCGECSNRANPVYLTMSAVRTSSAR